MLVKFVSPVSYLLLSQAFRKPWNAIVIVVVWQAQESQIIFIGVRVVTIEVSELSLCNFVLIIQGET